MAASAARRLAFKLDMKWDSSTLPGPLAKAVNRAVIATDADHRIVYWNRGAEKLYGWTESEALGRDILRVTPFEAVEAERILTPVEKGKGWSGEFRLRRKNGASFTGFVSIQPVTDDTGALGGFVGMSCAVGDTALAPARRWPLSSARLVGGIGRTVEMEPTSLPQLAIVLGAVGAATVLQTILGLYFPGLPPFSVYYPAILLAALLGGWQAGAATAALSALLAWYLLLAPQFSFEVTSRSDVVGLFVSLVSAAAIVAVAWWVRVLVRMLRDSHAALTARNFQYNALFDAMSEGFALCEAIRNEAGKLVDYVLIEINPALQKMLGVGPEVIGSRLNDSKGDRTAWLRVCDRVLQTGTPWKHTSYNEVTGRWHDIHIDRVGPGRMSQFFFDVTERKEAETRQAQLFAELNHRVKNNFAVVSAFLRMQAKDTSDTSVREQLMKAVHRVQSIAEIHGSLYKSGRTKDVEFGAYAKDLCDRLATTLLDTERVRLVVDVQPADLNLDTALSLGMIINELVTNAAKHAFPAPDKGAISVVFARSEDSFVLGVSDDGRGVTSDPEGPSKGLGLKLVPALAEQANATLSISNSPGLTYQLVIPMALAQSRKTAEEAVEYASDAIPPEKAPEEKRKGE
jgi:PAS domain S-box-containing protein